VGVPAPSTSAAPPPDTVHVYVPPAGEPAAVISRGCPGQATGTDSVIVTVTASGHGAVVQTAGVPPLPELGGVDLRLSLKSVLLSGVWRARDQAT
jgi:hypothetical protein